MMNSVKAWIFPENQPPMSLVMIGFSLGLLIISFMAHLLDTRMIAGDPIWAKPMKFAISFAVLAATLYWIELRFSPKWREGWLLKIAMLILFFAMLAEMGYMMAQAAKGEASHFNQSTPYHAFMYSVVMATGAFVIVSIIGLYGVVAFLEKEPDFGPALRMGIVSGCLLSFILTVIVAGHLGGNGSHHVGVPSANAATLPLVGWSAEVGDLRPAHFLSLHAQQILPIIGWYVDCRVNKVNGKHLMVIAAIGYAGVTFAVFLQALAGLPLISL